MGQTTRRMVDFTRALPTLGWIGFAKRIGIHADAAMKFIRRIQPGCCIVVFWSIAFSAALLANDRDAIDIGDRRELFVDKFLLDRLDGVELRLHSPTPREVVMVCDAAWEGSGCGYETVFRDGSIIRMYYIAADLTSADGTRMTSRPIFACYAESRTTEVEHGHRNRTPAATMDAVHLSMMCDYAERIGQRHEPAVPDA